MQHITTLSGAAILIILALVERAGTKREALLVGGTVPLFLIAALTSVIGVMFLLMHTGPAAYGKASARRLLTYFAGGMFSGGMITVAFFVAGDSYRLVKASIKQAAATSLESVLLVLVALLLLILLRWLRRRYWGYSVFQCS